MMTLRQFAEPPDHLPTATSWWPHDGEFGAR